MFGYFRFYSQYSSYAAQDAYKNYYCGTCFALGQHYGSQARMLLSYDITTLAILMRLHKKPSCDKIKCVGEKICKKNLFGDSSWKKIAAINVLLAAAKLDDDILDEKSTKAKIAKALYYRQIKKAKKEYSDIDEVITSGYKIIEQDEKEAKDVIQIGCHFADMMVGILKKTFSTNEFHETYIQEISRWVYFIDALDDYDEDVKKKRFNPLVIPNLNFSDYIVEKNNLIRSYLDKLYSKYDDIKSELHKENNIESEILISFIENTIPAVTAMVLNNIELPSVLHCRKW